MSPVVSLHLFGVDATPGQLKVTVSQDRAVTADENVVVAVKDAFAKDQDLVKFSSTVKVDAVGGVVTLSGTVPNDKVKADFGTRAKSVAGVTTVLNNLEVKGATSK